MMTTTKLTISDYLVIADIYEGRQEFIDGEIIKMPPESNLNALISIFLLVTLAQFVPVSQLRHKDVEVVISGRVRMPDLLVLSEDLTAILLASGRSTITEEMPAPLLAVEVVSPGKANEDRDYWFKRSEYAARGIPEYWIIDPEKAKVMVLSLVDGLYESVEYGESDSPQTAKLIAFFLPYFPNLI